MKSVFLMLPAARVNTFGAFVLLYFKLGICTDNGEKCVMCLLIYVCKCDVPLLKMLTTFKYVTGFYL